MIRALGRGPVLRYHREPMASAASSRQKKAITKAPPVPALGGRLFIAIGFVLSMAILNSPLAERPTDWMKEWLKIEETKPVDMTKWEPGQVYDISITLVTADYDKLACAYDKEVGGAHCEYKTESQRWPKDPDAPVDNNNKDVIQPYSAVPDNALVMVAGLWAQPEVAMRLHAEPPEGTEVKKLARFIAHCKVRPVERAENISIRWNKDDKWARGMLRLNEGETQVPPWIAITESCRVEDE
jgi:hypothetical protein